MNNKLPRRPIYKLIKEGCGDLEIAKKMNCSKNIISHIRQYELGKKRPRGGIQRQESSLNRELFFIKELLKNGCLTNKEINYKVNYKYKISPIYRSLKQKGFPVFRKKLQNNVLYFLKFISNKTGNKMLDMWCDNEKCNEGKMEYVEGSTDSRSEWTEESYECPKCGKVKTHRTEHDQNGLVTNDEVYDK